MYGNAYTITFYNCYNFISIVEKQHILNKCIEKADSVMKMTRHQQNVYLPVISYKIMHTILQCSVEHSYNCLCNNSGSLPNWELI